MIIYFISICKLFLFYQKYIILFFSRKVLHDLYLAESQCFYTRFNKLVHIFCPKTNDIIEIDCFAIEETILEGDKFHKLIPF